MTRETWLLKFGKGIRKRRKAAKLTQCDAALVLGVSQSTLSRWENGRACPDVWECKQMAKRYKVSIGKLIPDEYIGAPWL